MQEYKDIQHYGRLLKSQTSCGLMQEYKDIQLKCDSNTISLRCGLMQEYKDIQRDERVNELLGVVV